MKQCNDCERNLALRPNIYRDFFFIIISTALEEQQPKQMIKLIDKPYTFTSTQHTEEAITSPAQAKFRAKTPLNLQNQANLDGKLRLHKH